MQPDLQILATGLQFPEGPIAMPDGSILLVEIERGTLSRVSNGQIDVVAQLGGGPNGAAIGPDGACYICNNGGFEWIKVGDKTRERSGIAQYWCDTFLAYCGALRSVDQYQNVGVARRVHSRRLQSG
mgnify:CR=1 FL=1